ncbi:hypothetical protein J7I84_12510 [Arthrobacter sp. ISL-85]|uniref:hypothetical protein n=1 Tax=Arthrobacter sp. ISL-85 TaxID=2819115 RepID=UPI001BEA0966|nr:hypothetical protein [Arthrobacter sp. ISL-85]MBT2567303.1 hypothetical protein [Arthrobacter sp. ISL-85]
MPRSVIDYAITALNVLYWIVVAVWVWLMFTDDTATVNGMWFVGAALAVMIPYHLLKRRRRNLQEKTMPHPS